MSEPMSRMATQDEIDKIFAKMAEFEANKMKSEEALNALRISNVEKLKIIYTQWQTQRQQRDIEIEQQAYERAIKHGVDLASIQAQEKLSRNLEALDLELEQELAALDELDIVERTKQAERLQAEYNTKKENLINEDKAKRALNTKYQKDVAKIEALKHKERIKQDTERVKAVMEYLDFSNLTIGGKEAAREKLLEMGVEEDQVEGYLKTAKVEATYKALANIAKQLESTAKATAEAQSEIDTRLQGSKNKSTFGSYWKRMSDNITMKIGMSPFLKQETAVENLKTLVGKGIAFNVEQRAFLDTIGDKIATTFEATGSTLLKLVRIQQADSTAARLGMESALTAFLNNMYETTEYMTDAAESIRSSIYEASALMDAEKATEFEYQVQKWMGSLYSVGFQNTQGLADALGKLAAGDIDGITQGGFGNLLVMAANQANLPITEILQEGLDNTETNSLMQAMVSYLSGIYQETKDNKVVAQQFANVYGLTASDLKAAANLASSTEDIYKNNLNYGGMMTQLKKMANSMGFRTALGTMLQNLYDNLKFTVASSIGNDPALFAMYTAAGILDDTVGGIDIPSISALAMGSGPIIDLRTSVADLIRVGAMGGGILAGGAKMIAGLASGGGLIGSGMLRAFGVDLSGSKASTVERGSGKGLLTTDSGADTSYSGYVGNEDSQAIQDKVLTDAQDDANKQAIQALEEAQNIGLVNVDEHIVQIYTLLNDVTLGSRKLHVINDTLTSGSAWTTNGVPASL